MTEAISNIYNDYRNTLVYCRESRDDYGVNYERIETQRDMLLDFCKKRHLINIVDIIMDDDVSGTSFKRFDKIISRIKKEKIEVIVFKDSSRLGRNLLESLKLIQIFEENGVEIFFVTESYNEDVFPLFAWFNEQRAKEDSKKIRGVFLHKMRTGELLIKPIYGYKKSSDNTLVIDEESSKVVQKIFKLFLDGKGTRQIATILNYEGVSTPSQFNLQKQQCPVWNLQHIWRILGQEEYTGVKIYHKRTVLSFKNKKIVNSEPKDWITIDNHHEAIISLEDFNQAQFLRKKISRMKRSNPFHSFAGVLVCGRCGHSLIIRNRNSSGLYYICSKNNSEGAIKNHIRDNYGCTNHKISEEYLIKFAKEYINNILLLNKTKAEKIIMDGQAEGNQNIDKEINTLKNTITSTNKILEQIYDDKLKGVVSADLFDKKYKQYSEILHKSEHRLSELDIITIGQVESKIQLQTIEAIASKIQNGTLDRISIQSMFDKIIIFDELEITSTQKEEYNLSEEAFAYLYQNGGILVVENLRNGMTVAQY